LSPAVTSSPGRGKSALSGERARPQRCAFAESGAANAVFRYDSSRENAFGALRKRGRSKREIENDFSTEYG